MTTPARPSPFNQLISTGDWEALLQALGNKDGVDGTSYLGTLAPSLDTVGRNAVMGPGQAVIKGQLWTASSSVSTPIPGASAQNRWDRLVLQINRGATTAATVIQPIVLTGTPSGTPVEPPLTQTPTGIYQIPICSWTSASAGSISGLIDERQFSVDVWHTITLDAGWTSLSGYAVPQYKLSGGELHLAGAAQIANASQGGQHTMNSSSPLPQNYRPPSTHDFRVSDATGVRCHMSITNTGTISAYPYPGFVAPGQLIAEIDAVIPLI